MKLGTREREKVKKKVQKSKEHDQSNERKDCKVMSSEIKQTKKTKLSHSGILHTIHVTEAGLEDEAAPAMKGFTTFKETNKKTRGDLQCM